MSNVSRHMRASHIAQSALAAVLLAQAALACRLYATTHQSYDRSDAITLFAVAPAAALVLCAYALLRSAQAWGKHRSKPPSPSGGAIALFVAGAVLGLLGLWLAYAGGPHVAGVLVFWPLLFQVTLFALARLSVHRWERSAALGVAAK